MPSTHNGHYVEYTAVQCQSTVTKR